MRSKREPRIPSFAVKPTGPVRAFSSRPDLHPPTVTVKAGEKTELLVREDPPGFLFLGPGPVALTGSQQYGPLIVDRDGEPVWFRPVTPGLEVTNFTSSAYRGKPVLIWWEGRVLTTGYGQGEAVILDHTYRELGRVRAANNRSMDMHSLLLTPEGTAVFTCYPQVADVDLRSVGGPRRGRALESIIQEVDVASGRLLFEWTSLGHIPVTDSYHPLWAPYDYLHVNSVGRAPDGNLLISGRHTWSIYKLDRRTGEVIWSLGGKRSDFRMGQGTRFAWQHDARQLSDRILTVFDNGTDGPIRTEGESRGLVLDLDEPAQTVALSAAYTNREPLLATAMGSVQVLSSGSVVIGWGTASHTTELAPDGRSLLDASLPSGLYSYRGLWLGWTSNPHHRPVARPGRDAQRRTKLIYASWNGATEMTDWRVSAGPSPADLRPVGIAKRVGFETVIPLRGDARFVSVTALDAFGRELRRSRTIRL